MSIYRLSIRIVSRGMGQSAVVVAARHAAQRLYDRRRGLQVHPDRGARRPTFSEIMLPTNTPAWLSEREELWNAVEAAEPRVDAQLARAVELALPSELEDEQAIELARDFIQQEFIQRGMIADLNIYPGGHNPWANALLTLREFTAAGFGPKVIAWNQAGLLHEWRAHWVERAREYLCCAGHAVRIDHRRTRDQVKQGAAATMPLGKAASSLHRPPDLVLARLQRFEAGQGGKPVAGRA